MEYKYKLTYGEAAGCGLRLALQRLGQRSMLVIGIFLVIIGVTVLNVAVSATDGGLVAGAVWGGAFVMVATMVWLVLGMWIIQTRRVIGGYGGEERILTLEDGILTVSTSREAFRYRCCRMGEVKQRGSVYWIQVSAGGASGGRAAGGAVSGGTASGGIASGGRAAGGAASGGAASGSGQWLFLPVRVMGGKDGQARFVRLLEEQRQLPGDIPDSLWIKAPENRKSVDSQPDDFANRPYRSLDEGLCIIQERDFPQALMVTAQWDWIQKQCLTGWKRRRYVYMPVAVGIVVVLAVLQDRELGGTGGILLGAAAYYYLRLFRDWQRLSRPVPLLLLRKQMARIWPESRKGRYQLTADRTGIWKQNPMEEHFWAWSELGWLLESENRFFLCTRKEALVAVIDKELLGEWLNRKLFIQDCQNQGLHWEMITPQINGSVGEVPPGRTGAGGKAYASQPESGGRRSAQPESGKAYASQPESGGRRSAQSETGESYAGQTENRGRQAVHPKAGVWQQSRGSKQRDVAAVWRKLPHDKGEGNGRIIFTLCIVAALAAAAFFLPEYGGRGGGYGFYPEVEAGREDGFQPELYPDYVPLEEQVKVLGELGILVPEEDIETLQNSMAEDEQSRIWIEGYPYYTLLSYLGMPEWDQETWEVTSYPDQAFWFDWEAFDLEESYREILSSINDMSGGSCAVTDIQIDMSEVDWEDGGGRIAVRFQVNGVAQECTVAVENDWLDPVFLEYINRGLKAAGVTERIYAMDDGGQGSILFFRNRDWAKEFEKKTGVRLE